MPCWPNVNGGPTPVRPSAALCGLLLCALFSAGARAAPGIDIASASSRIVNDIYVVDADIRYDLGDEAKSALENGIPLTFDIEIEFKEVRDYLWDPVVASITQRLRLEYHALSGKYLVSNLSTRTRRSYPGLAEALQEMGELRSVAVSEKRFLSPDGNYNGRIRALLDIEELPAPMRPIAYLSPSWHLKSRWRRWMFSP